jgi:hypothetical protein
MLTKKKALLHLQRGFSFLLRDKSYLIEKEEKKNKTSAASLLFSLGKSPPCGS